MTTTFDCSKYCVNHHDKGGWCAGKTSTNFSTTHMTPLPHLGSWDGYGDLGAVQAPSVDDRGLPHCAGFNVNCHIAAEVIGKGIIFSTACRTLGSQYFLSEGIVVGDILYSAVVYRNTGVTQDRYFLCTVGEYEPRTGTYKLDYDQPWEELPEVSIKKISMEAIDIMEWIP